MLKFTTIYILNPINILITSAKKRYKVNMAITSSNFIFLDFLAASQGYFVCLLLFLLYFSNLSKHTGFFVEHLAADDILYISLLTMLKLQLMNYKLKFKSKSEQT